MRDEGLVDTAYFMLSLCALGGIAAAVLFGMLWFLGIPAGMYLTIWSLRLTEYYEDDMIE